MLWLAPVFLLLAGCAAQPTLSFQNQIQQGDLAGAQKTLESLYTNQKSRVLHNFYQASLHQLNGDFAKSNSILEQTKPLAEELALLSITETVGASTVGESLQSYSGSQFERLMIYCHKFLNYMALGLFNEARIESQQAESKLREWQRDPKDFPFLPFLSALAYEGLGDADNALVAYRRTLEAYGANAPQVIKQSYLNVLARHNRQTELRDRENQFGMKAQYAKERPASLVILLTDGMVNSREVIIVDHWDANSNADFTIALPTYPPSQAIIAAPSLSINEMELRSQILINMEDEMRAALARQMSGYVARAVSRAIVRSQLRQQTQQENAPTLGFLLAIAGTITEIATADTRSWDILPQALFAERIELPNGNHTMTTYITGTGFSPYNQEFQLEPGFNFVLVQGR